MSREAFRGVIAADLCYDTTCDMWVRRDGNTVEIGITTFGIFLAGEIIAFTAKPKGAEIGRGRGLGTVECAKTVLAVHAPLSFVLGAGNDELEENPAALNRDPYAAWLVRGEASNWEAESARLVDADAYRAHVRSIEPEAEFL